MTYSPYQHSPGLAKPAPPRRVGIPDAPWQVGLGPKPKTPRKKASAPPPTDTQLAQQQIDPLIQAITDHINGRAQAAGTAITGYTDALAHALSQINYGSPYASAIPQQAAVDSALQQSLAGKGNDEAQGLASRLASIQEPHAVDPAVQAVQQFGVGTGNTQLAQGSASLGNLLANQASAGEYGLKQPGIAKLSGVQALGKVNAQAVNDIADQTGQLTGKIPDVVANIQTNRANQQTATARQQQINLENRLANKKYGLDVKKTNAGITQASERIGVAQQNARTAQARVAIETANAELAQQKVAIANAQDRRDFQQKVAQGAKPNASLSRIYGFVVDSNGNPILNAKGRHIPVAKTSTRSANPFDTAPPVPGGK